MRVLEYAVGCGVLTDTVPFRREATVWRTVTFFLGSDLATGG